MQTFYRAKLPQSLSYPLGLEVIRMGLAKVPQLEQIRVRFSSGHWEATKFRRSLRDREPYGILDAAYRPAGKAGYSGSESMDRSGLFEEAWDLTIKPTLRELRSPARQLLIEEGLPMIAAWLRDAHSRTGEQRYRRLELIFDPDNDSLAPREFIGA